jgi:hypothetical protein
MELGRWWTWGKAVEEIAVAQPRQGIPSVVAGKFRAEQEAQGREQRRHDMTQRAGVTPVGSGLNDLKRVQRRMADLHKQHRKAEEDEQGTGATHSANARPAQLWPPFRRAMGFLALSQSIACELARCPFSAEDAEGNGGSVKSRDRPPVMPIRNATILASILQVNALLSPPS